MTRSLAALTDSVYQQMEGGWVNDDSRLPYGLVRDKVLRVMWEVIGQYYSKWVGMLPDVLYQRCCIEVDCKEVCDSGLYRKEGKLPGMMGTLNGRELRYVGSVQGVAYERTTTRIAYENYQPYAGKPAVKYRITGETIELLNAPLGLDVVEVEGIFADPTACGLCVPDDQFILPLSAELYDSIEKKCLVDFSQPWANRVTDKRNDAIPNN